MQEMKAIQAMQALPALQGKKGLVVGIANDGSIAWGCASALRAAGAEHNCGLMGPVKAALESTVRYLAAELGPQGIRVNAISPGPMATRAASGIADFDSLLADAARRAPLRRLVDIDDVGAVCAFLASDAARSIAGTTLFVGAGHHILN